MNINKFFMELKLVTDKDKYRECIFFITVLLKDHNYNAILIHYY